MSGADNREDTAAALERARRRADDWDRGLDEFLRVAGHELRSPLTAMQLQIDTLIMAAQQSAPPLAIEERAGRIRRSIHKLGWVIEEVLDLGRASGGRLPLRVAEVDLVNLARRALDRLSEELVRTGCEARLGGAAEVHGMWDAQRVEHAIGSLVIAALKSGAGSEIEIDVRIDEADQARVEIRDGGAGLPPAQAALVFQPFERVMAGLQAGSPLLGLWLARVVAEAHGGGLLVAPGRTALHLPKLADRREG